MIEDDILNLGYDDLTPITEDTFEKQKWIKVIEDDGTGAYYFMMPLPKDNPDEDCAALISNSSDEFDLFGLEKGQYCIQLLTQGSIGLGFSTTEEELEVLYMVLTGQDIMED